MVSNSSVSAVICTKNSISGISECIQSLRAEDVGEVIVVDAHSTDGTAEVALELADKLVTDPGTGLGNARNMGIAKSTKEFILNMGSDNVMPPGQLGRMLDYLTEGDFHGVSAQTKVIGSGFTARGLNAWREGRFQSGPRNVIGTPTLFPTYILKAHPYDPSAVFSDDSELCQRWKEIFQARFAISDAYVYEIGKNSWNEVVTRCKMYGASDHEIFAKGKKSGWSPKRKYQSILHPLTSDFLTPIRNLPIQESIVNTPFLALFAALRYRYWIQESRR